MVIEVNKDIDRYKETVVMGLTARQLVFSIASVVVGGGIVLLLQICGVDSQRLHSNSGCCTDSTFGVLFLQWNDFHADDEKEAALRF